MSPPQRGIALGGFMGTGKSTAGRLIARRLGMPWVDLDEVLVQRHGEIAAQFRDEGEAIFRGREARALRELCDGVPRVLSTGGGAWVSTANRVALERSYFTVVLTAPFEVLQGRLQGPTGRPLWGEGVRALYEARREAYGQAQLVVDTSTNTPEEVVQIIVKVWRTL